MVIFRKRQISLRKFSGTDLQLTSSGSQWDISTEEWMPFTSTRNFSIPPASEVSREVTNLTERKNPHTPVYGVKEFACLSVCGQDYLIFHLTRTKNHLKNVCNFGYQSCFCKPVFLPKQLICDFLAGNNYSGSPHSQGVWNLPHKFHFYLILDKKFRCAHIVF